MATQEMDARWARIVQNDLENGPYGLIMAWGSALVTKKPELHVIFASMFVIGRWLHTWAYAN